MKHFSRLGLLSISFVLPLFAAGSPWPFSFPADVEVGSNRLPRGRCDISWSGTSGSQGLLTIRPEGKTPISLPARVIHLRHTEVGITTFVDNGVTYLQDFHTTDETFIISASLVRTK